ncbi:DUF2914 domain-containing protein [Sandaracinus amylolyticus]|uniref:DUF2914 domain-containing protein n=1 Tax=Sandaracinus amylolyticus TaxID=927083 RepID=A0A0F6YHI5_9BACT|nr:DUF2914 domain-containing protein [Sandaracinus amylolyticus]AKF05170.1 hypothetical protein DB32_002319 [Sandaracinus amylolyticus]
MRKTIVIATVMALAGGGAGVAIGAATFARADDHTPRTEVVRTTTTTTRVEAPPAAPPITTTTTTRDEREDHGELRVRRLVLTRGIEGREPIDELDALELDERLERVYAFLDVANDADEARALTITFEREGGDEVTGHVDLEVPARVGRWRTWAFTRHIDRAGTWRVVVRDDAGRELASHTFDVR